MAASFLRSQTVVRLPYPEHAFTGQTVIVTGANVGLGLEAVRHLVRLDAAKVILASRSLERGDAAKASIEQSTGKRSVVEVWQLDLASYDSVRAFASRAARLSRLDAVIENAAVYTYTFGMAEDNEATVTVNVVSTFLLALLLMPKLRETAVLFGVALRLSIVTSFTHVQTRFPQAKADSIFDELNKPDKADMNDRYNVTKLLEIYVVRQVAGLSSRSDKQGTVILSCLNPGFCRSNIMREATGPSRIFIKGITAILARTTEEGSRTLVSAAQAGPEAHGQYLDDCQVGKLDPSMTSEKGASLQ